MNREPDDADRYPTLSDTGRALLQRMREHPAAPLFRNRSGNRLLPDDVHALRQFEAEMAAAPIEWTPETPPAWLHGFLHHVFAEVPYYRAMPRPAQFTDIPTVSRADLAADIARFVPDSVPVDRMINFRTTGTTGHPLLVASHPQVAARYLAFHKRALRRAGVELHYGVGQVGVILLGHQQRCFTYVSVTPSMGESGLAKINLHPNDWRDPADRAWYLDAMAPEVLAGDPISFAELLHLDMTHRPRALLSVAMALSPGLRQALGERFGCPVLDLYSMNEAGPIATWVDALGGHLLLQPQMYVEILDAAGKPLPSGERGEIALTGGFNFCLPLLRYRTGDFGALALSSEGPLLRGLAGRQPVRFRTRTGSYVNNIDLTHALADLPLSRYACHQFANGSVQLSLAAAELGWGQDAAQRIAQLLQGETVTVRGLQGEDKPLQYSSDLPSAAA